jgi:hypothetical protein
MPDDHKDNPKEIEPEAPFIPEFEDALKEASACTGKLQETDDSIFVKREPYKLPRT